MVLKIIKSDKHASKLVTAVADLFDKPDRYYDVEVEVGTTVFQCHKLILALQSKYFQSRLFQTSTSRSTVHQIVLEAVAPNDFKQVLQFIYRGDIQLETETVGGILHVAKMTDMDELQEVCVQFMKDTLDVATCVTYWKVAEDVNDSELRRLCLDLFVKEFVPVTKISNLQDITQDMMKDAVERDDLNVTSEVEVCDTLITWLDANSRQGRTILPFQLLSLVRWSGINIEYIKSKIINNETLIKDQECFEFLSKVISYGISGIQFPGLRTRHRPSTELDTCLVIFGVIFGSTRTPGSCRLSLHNKTSHISDIGDIPTTAHMGIFACNNNHSAYVTGLGSDDKEMWRWQSIGGWTRCADLIEGRLSHCATFVNNTSMYVLGGCSFSTKTTLSSVEHYDTRKNKWTTVGQLSHCVQCHGCVTYKTSVYLFGGCLWDESTSEVVDFDLIQEYDTTTNQCTVLTQRLDRPQRLRQAVLWDKSVILMSKVSCLIFDLELKTIQQRHQFTPGIRGFGLVIDNETLFVIGGGVFQSDSSGGFDQEDSSGEEDNSDEESCCDEETWTCTDEVKSVPVMDIINNQQTVNWTQHSKLKSPCLVQAFSLLTLT